MKRLNEFFAIHTALAHNESHDFAFLLAHNSEHQAGSFDQRIEDSRSQLEKFEELTEFLHLILRLLGLVTVLGDRFFGLGALTLQCREALLRFYGIRSCFGLFVVIVVVRIGFGDFLR